MVKNIKNYPKSKDMFTELIYSIKQTGYGVNNER